MDQIYQEFDDPYWSLLAQAKRPSRYCGCEWGANLKGNSGNPRKPLSARASSRSTLLFCLAFPDVYEIGMSYYGFQILENFLNRLPSVQADRVYCPWTDMEALLRKSSLPLVSIENKIPLYLFDIVGFTLQHELSYTNILTMLDLSGIPLRATGRSSKHPLIIGGGCGALVPGAILPFFDMFCIGDGEEVLPELCSCINDTKSDSRDKRLSACSKIPGVYVPGIQNKVKRVYSINMPPVPESLIVPSAPVVHDRAAVELFRGCTRGCRFCQAGIVTRPVRERSVTEVVNGITNLVTKTGWEEAGLLSLASCDFTGIEHVLRSLSGNTEFGRRGFKVSLPSLRMDAFSVELAAGMEHVKRGSLTFAPEAGTQRLRNVINKGIKDEDIDLSLEFAFSKGWNRIKLYFMMGLPTETEEDLGGIIEIAARAIRIARSYKNKRAEISISVAGFVPKAHTPFQWERQNSISELKEKGRMIKGKNKNRSITLNYHSPEQTFLEGVYARGDIKLADALEFAWRDGARFDNWTETFDLARWNRAFEKAQVDPDSYTGERDLAEVFSWDFIDLGVTKEFLLRERDRALSEEITHDCRSACSGCGMQGLGCSLSRNCGKPDK